MSGEDPSVGAVLSGSPPATEEDLSPPPPLDDVFIVPVSDGDDEEASFPVPDYVCCAVTEGVWTWFFCILLIVVLFAVATLKSVRCELEKVMFVLA